MTTPARVPPPARFKAWALAFGLAATITLINEVFVGRVTIYQPEYRAQRQLLHDAVLNNRLPEGATSWNEVGANGLNIRRASVWLAQAFHDHLGVPVLAAHRMIESLALFAACLLLFAWLERYFGAPLALAGLALFGVVTPMTFFFNLFHPEDKPSLVAWILALAFLQRRRWIALAVVLFLGMLIKYDLLLFPALVFLVEVRRDKPAMAVLRAALCGVITLGVYQALLHFYPGGAEPRPILHALAQNASDALGSWKAYPPVLGLGLVALLALAGWRRADWFARCCVLFAALQLLVLTLQTNVMEFRAQTAVFVMLLPAALYTLKDLLAAPVAANQPA